MHVAVVVPVRNTRPEQVRRCLASVSRANAPSHGVAMTIVVSDDRSAEQLSAEYRHLAAVHGAEYVRSPVWRGIGGARNLGAAQVRSVATHVMFVDADDEIAPHAVAVMAEAATAGSIVTALCRVTGRGTPYIPPKAPLMRLVQTYNGSRMSPLLHLNVIGQPALVPLNAFNAVSGYVERCYSGEHVDLWGRLLLSGAVRAATLLPTVLYHYHSSTDGNYRRHPSMHRRGIAAALQELSRRYFNDEADYAWAASGRPFPTLYVPTSRDETLLLPPWARLDRDRWRPNTTRDGLLVSDPPTELRIALPQIKAIK